MYLIVSNPVHNTSEKRIYSRSSVVPTIYIGSEVIIHSGRRWHRKFVNKWLVGFRFGEFTWNRRLALYKAKQLRKKNKKLNKVKNKK